MNFLTDRIIDVLTAKLPAVLSLVNAKMSASDITRYGAALTLASPVYHSGEEANIEQTPAINVYVDSEDVITQADETAGEDKVMVMVIVHLEADQKHVLYEMMDRYLAAVRFVLRGNYSLQDINRHDPLAESIDIIFGSPVRLQNKNKSSIFRLVGILGVEVSMLIDTVEAKYGIV
jgi:hypothetical protein